ncbi:hypothetical protein [Bifidobacterium simiarum]|uniref:hypothetical protein n=1 Tax=Bifidobacterium simiarum TaxID=2045441 RepID=UPI001BDD80C8|nr:hypothetical protein [Bifidobacterium simiarum]MBT1166514.1 hypothetical protein [Bifidobacterium simiarum]
MSEQDTRTAKIIVTLIAAFAMLMGVLYAVRHLPVASNVHQSFTRAHVYSSLSEMFDDSDLVIQGTVLSQHSTFDIDETTPFTIAEVSVTKVHKGTPSSAERIAVRQTGSSEGSLPLHIGDHYVLFLTESGLSGDKAKQYYITGATAGAYQLRQGQWRQNDESHSTGSADYHRIDMDSGDDLPSDISVRDLEQFKK